jgi:hypothetical protein
MTITRKANVQKITAATKKFQSIGKVYILFLLLLLIGCVKKPVQAPVSGKVVNPSCVSNLRCDGEWVMKENDQLLCSGKLRANLACIPAK